jgi:hypothetical protein
MRPIFNQGRSIATTIRLKGDGPSFIVIFHKETTGKVTHMILKEQGQELRAKKIK